MSGTYEGYFRHSLVASAAIACVATATPALAQTRTFNVPAQDAATGVATFAKQADIQLLIAARDARGRRTNAVYGNLTVDEGMRKLLANTGLRAQATGSQTFSVVSSTVGNVSVAAETAASKGEDNGSQSSQAIVVTGTNIRGADATSPTHVFTADEIRRSGAGTVADFLQRVPQNFGGGAEENTIDEVTGGNGVANTVGGTGINLRGLGNTSTLVLLNGRRLSPGNYLGNFVDVSLIPMAALDRVEIVTDGASAIYGSDAVGGVVNFILKKGWEGAETRVRYGTVTEGGRREFQFGQTIGVRWRTGSLLGAYEHFDQTPLEAKDRDFTVSAPQPFDLLGKQHRDSLLLNGTQELGDHVSLFTTALYSQRRFFDDVADPSFGAQHAPARVKSYDVTAGIRGDPTEELNWEVSGSTSHSNTHQQTIDLIRGTLLANRYTRTTVNTLDAKLDGILLTLPMGDVRYAIGGQLRRETYDFSNVLATTQIYDNSRTVKAAFGEIQIPLVPGGSKPAIELSLADRYESYSDFGTTNNPKIGMIWHAAPGLNLRGSWGTSFKAPLFSDLNPVPSFVGVFIVPDPQSPGGLGNGIIIFGGNPKLTPEKAKEWSAGFDWSDKALGLKSHFNLFHINYRNRILNPINSIGIADAYANPSLLGPGMLVRDPTAAEVAALYATLGFGNFSNTPQSQVNSILDFRTRNLASVKTSGLDFDVSWHGGPQMAFGLGISGTYLFKFQNQVTKTAPIVDILNTPYQPNRIKMRGSATYDAGPLSVAAFVNYVGKYEDQRITPYLPVSSWVTFDASVAYNFSSTTPFGRGLSIQLSAINLTDKAPPYVRQIGTQFKGITYDGANANPLGRFVSVELRKSW